MSFVKEILDRMPQHPVRQVTCKCVAASPYTFYLEGDTTTPVPCRVKAGSTFAPGDTGMADWKSGSPPLCYKTT